MFITTATPARLQAAAGALINSLLYVGLAFWLGIADLAIATTVRKQGEDNVDIRDRYRIGFWTGVGLAAVAMCLTCTVNPGTASAGMTADEKAALEREANQQDTRDPLPVINSDNSVLGRSTTPPSCATLCGDEATVTLPSEKER